MGPPRIGPGVLRPTAPPPETPPVAAPPPPAATEPTTTAAPVPHEVFAGTGSSTVARDVVAGAAAPAPVADAALARGVQSARTLPNVSPSVQAARTDAAAHVVTSGPLASAATPAEVPGNVMALHGSVGPGATNHAADVRLVQQRMTELGLYGGAVDGAWNDDLGHAITDFQAGHDREIRGVVRDGSDPTFRDSTYARATQRTRTAGRIEPNDPTAVALAQAWPHTVGGRSMTEEEAHDYYAGQVRARGLPFDESATHVIGIRGYQGGTAVANDGSGTRANAYNDTMVVLSRGEDGRPHVREFRATVDPGAHSDVSGVDPRTFALGADQQATYRLESRTHNTGHAGRPGLAWQAREGTDAPAGHSEELLARYSGRDEDFDARGRAMIHSGDAGETVGGSSLGCQVVQGSWYPSFYNELERNAGVGGTVRYTLLDGTDLAAAH